MIGHTTPGSMRRKPAKSDTECRLSKNGEVIYNDDCTVKDKVSEVRESFVVKFDNGKIYRFSGPNRQNLRIEDDFANAFNVLFEDKGSKGSSAGMMATAPTNSLSKLAPPPVVATTERSPTCSTRSAAWPS